MRNTEKERREKEIERKRDGKRNADKEFTIVDYSLL